MKLDELKILAIFFLWAIPFAQAETKSQNAVDKAHTISVPLNNTDGAPLLVKQAKELNKDGLELGFSSWSPNTIQGDTKIQDPSGFHFVSPGTVSVTWIQSLNAQLNLDLGLAFLAERRTGSLGASPRSEQNIYVSQVAVGAEYLPSQGKWGIFQALGELSVIPSFLVIARSAFDEGQSEFGIPVRASLGGLFQLTSGAAAVLKASESLGKAGDSSLSGLSVGLGLRVLL